MLVNILHGPDRSDKAGPMAWDVRVRLRAAVRVMGSLLLLGCCAWAQDGNSAPSLDPGTVVPGHSASEMAEALSRIAILAAGRSLPTSDPGRQISGIRRRGKVASHLQRGRSQCDGAARSSGPCPPGMQSSFTTLYEASVVQRQSSAFLGKFLYPSLLKQDPRYYPSTSGKVYAGEPLMPRRACDHPQ